MTVRQVRAVSNALVVIEAIAVEQPVGVGQLARSTGLDKSLVQRLLVTLHDGGWIVPASGTPRRWQISSKPLSLLRSTHPLHLLELASNEMARLRNELNETVILAAPQRGRMVVIDIARSRTALRIDINEAFAFSRTSAAAVAYLAALPPEQEADFLELNEAQELADQVAAARRLGYAMLDTEDLLNVACAIVDEKDFPFATLSLTVPLFRVGPGDRERLAEKLVASALNGPWPSR